MRVSLPAGDPLAYLLDDNWTATHWFATRTDRDAALREMARLHEYSRPLDKPALVFAAIDRDAERTLRGS